MTPNKTYAPPSLESYTADDLLEAIGPVAANGAYDGLLKPAKLQRDKPGPRR